MATTTYNLLKSVSLVKYEKPFVFGSEGLDWGYEPLIGMETSKTMTKQIYPMSGLGIPSLTKELQQFYYGDIAELSAVTITMYKYTLSWLASYEALLYAEQNAGDLMGQRGKEMGANHKYLKGLLIANLYNNIATDTAYDSVAVSGSHTTRAGNSVDNALTAASLDFDTAWDMYDFFRTSMYTEAGLKVQAKPFALVGHPSLRRKFEKIFGSQSEPDTVFTGNKNTLSDKGIRFIENPHATSSTRFTMVSDGIKNDVRCYVVKPPQYDTEDDGDRHAMKFRSFQILGMGWIGYQHAVSNPGA